MYITKKNSDHYAGTQILWCYYYFWTNIQAFFNFMRIYLFLIAF